MIAFFNSAPYLSFMTGLSSIGRNHLVRLGPRNRFIANREAFALPIRKQTLPLL